MAKKQNIKQKQYYRKFNKDFREFPGGSVVKNPPANARAIGSIPSHEESTCLEESKPMYHNY